MDCSASCNRDGHHLFFIGPSIRRPKLKEVRTYEKEKESRKAEDQKSGKAQGLPQEEKSGKAPKVNKNTLDYDANLEGVFIF